MSRKISKSARLDYLKQLYSLYGNEYTHTLPAEAEENSLTEYTITIKYPPKLKCKENELVSEFNSLWPIVTKKWLTFEDSIPSSNRIRRFWMHIVEEHYIEYPNLSDLVLILFSISPGTGPLERSFSPWRQCIC